MGVEWRRSNRCRIIVLEGFGLVFNVSTQLSKDHAAAFFSDVKASRPDWSRGQNFGFGLGFGLDKLPVGLGLNLASKMCYPMLNKFVRPRWRPSARAEKYIRDAGP